MMERRRARQGEGAETDEEVGENPSPPQVSENIRQNNYWKKIDLYKTALDLRAKDVQDNRFLADKRQLFDEVAKLTQASSYC